MKRKIMALLLTIIMAVSLCGCGKSMLSIEGDDWTYVTMTRNGEEVSPEFFELMELDLPTIKCGKNDFTLNWFNAVIEGKWKTVEDDAIEFMDENGDTFFYGALAEGDDAQFLMIWLAEETIIEFARAR